MYRRRFADGDPHDVVILDLTVPGGMGGAAALERLREMDPGVVAIACSGYFEEGVMADPGKFGFAGVLGKPYPTADLEQALAAATGGQPRWGVRFARESCTRKPLDPLGCRDLALQSS
jgi:CheY-like chemotaxis protein